MPTPDVSNSCKKMRLQKSQILENSKPVKTATLMILGRWTQKVNMDTVDFSPIPSNFCLVMSQAVRKPCFSTSIPRGQNPRFPDAALDKLSDPGMKCFRKGDPRCWHIHLAEGGHMLCSICLQPFDSIFKRLIREHGLTCQSFPKVHFKEHGKRPAARAKFQTSRIWNFDTSECKICSACFGSQQPATIQLIRKQQSIY